MPHWNQINPLWINFDDLVSVGKLNTHHHKTKGYCNFKSNYIEIVFGEGPLISANTLIFFPRNIQINLAYKCLQHIAWHHGIHEMLNGEHTQLSTLLRDLSQYQFLKSIGWLLCWYSIINIDSVNSLFQSYYIIEEFLIKRKFSMRKTPTQLNF